MKKKILIPIILITIIIISLLILRNIKFKPSEKKIIEDIQNTEMFTALELKITDLNILLSDTSNKSNISYDAHATMKNSYESIEGDLKIYYVKYDQGWILNSCQMKTSEIKLIDSLPDDLLYEMVDEASQNAFVSTEEDYDAKFKILSHTEDLENQTLNVTFEEIEIGKYATSTYTYEENFEFVEGKLNLKNRGGLKSLDKGILIDSSVELNTDALINAKIDAEYYPYYGDIYIRKIDVKNDTTITVSFDYVNSSNETYSYSRTGHVYVLENDIPVYAIPFSKEYSIEINHYGIYLAHNYNIFTGERYTNSK